jgi:hypothetical protein
MLLVENVALTLVAAVPICAEACWTMETCAIAEGASSRSNGKSLSLFIRGSIRWLSFDIEGIGERGTRGDTCGTLAVQSD